MKSLLLSADENAAYYRNDIELEESLPTRPRLIPELLVLPFGSDGLLFVGSRESQVVRSPYARTFLPRVLDAMDGRRDMEGLLVALPRLNRDEVFSVIALLYSRGLLEDGCPEICRKADPDVAAYLGRYVDVSRLNRNRTEALERLGETRLMLVGSEGVARTLSEMMLDAGVGEVRFEDDPRGLAGCTFLLGVADGDRDDLSAVFGRACDLDIPGFHAHLGAGRIEIGPYFIPGATGCLECMRTLYPSPTGQLDSESLDFWLAYVAFEVFLAISRVVLIKQHNGFEEIDVARPEPAFRTVARLPGCARCRLSDSTPLEVGSPELLAWLHRTSLEMPPSEWTSSRYYQIHYSMENRQAAFREPPRYFGGERILLPPSVVSEPSLPWFCEKRVRKFSLEALAYLLSRAVGYQTIEGRFRRVAPTGGGLGSPEIYLVANEIEGLKNGVYRYYGLEHVLEEVGRAERTAVESAIGIRGDLPRCVLVGIGALGKLRRKYGPRGFNIVHLDAGVAKGYLRDLSAYLGLSYREYSEFHRQALCGLLGIPSEDGMYTLLFVCSVGPVGREGSSSVEKGGLTDRLLASTRGRARSVTGASSVVPSRLYPSLRPAEPALSFDDVVTRRRSVRDFASQPLESETIVDLLRVCRDGLEEDVEAGAYPIEVRPWLCIREGTVRFPAGTYECRTQGRDRGIERRSNFVRMERWLNQRSLARAAMLMVFTVDLEEVFAKFGSDGYRSALIRVGVAAERTWIAAEAAGLGGCALGGLIEPEFRKETKTNGYRDCILLTLAIGHRAEARLEDSEPERMRAHDDSET